MDYKVGYKKPPVETRFKKGHSANPKGRPKGSKNFSTVMTGLLEKKITLTEGGVTKKVPVMEAVGMRLIQKALNGDPKAIQYLMTWSEKREEKHPEPPGPLVISWKSPEPPPPPDVSCLTDDELHVYLGIMKKIETHTNGQPPQDDYFHGRKIYTQEELGNIIKQSLKELKDEN